MFNSRRTKKPIRRRWLPVRALAWVCGVLLAASAQTLDADAKPNVLLIVCDDLNEALRCVLEVRCIEHDDQHIWLRFAFKLAEDHGIVLLNGSGFEAPGWSARVSFANLNDDAYLAIGRAVRAVARGYVQSYRAAKGLPVQP